MLEINEKYFVYEHRLLSGCVFYVGRGTAASKYGYCSRAYSKWDRNADWKYITSNYEYEVVIVFTTNDLNLAKLKEVELISKYGRYDLGLGTLVNMSDGGNDAGVIQSEYTRNAKKRFGSDNHFYGKKHSSISISTGRQNQPGVKPLISGDGLSFESSTLAAKYYKVDRKAIKRCIDGKITAGKLKGVVLNYA